MTLPRPLRNPEVCVNLWAYADEAGYIARVAARSYVLDGDDAAKLAVLHRLAATDFLHAEWMGVSKQFVISNPNGGWEFPAVWAVALVVQSLIGDGALAQGLQRLIR